MTFTKPILPESPASKDESPYSGKYIYPKIGNVFATLYVAVTFVIMMFSGLFGIYLILLLYAIWLPRMYYKGQFILWPTKDLICLLSYLSYCLLSVLWSDYRSVTLRDALELASMLACVIIISRVVSTNAFIAGMVLGATLVLLPLLANGFSYEGWFGSKNQVGLVAEIGIYASLVFAFSGKRRLPRLLFSLGPLAFSAYCLKISSSASSVVSLAAALAVSATAWSISSLPQRWRKLCLLAAGFFAIALIGAGYLLDWQDALFQSLGKDTTLTGRTYLWEKGFSVGWTHPVLGDGYWAFWVPGRPDAEALWYKFDIFSKNGFHFHDIYVQCFVDLGLVGLFIVCTAMALNLYKCAQRLIAHGADLKGRFFLGLAFMLFIRSFVEVDFLEPFGIGTLLFFMIQPHLAAAEGEKSATLPLPFANKMKFPPSAIMLPRKNGV